jgi:hypothetical protein
MRAEGSNENVPWCVTAASGGRSTTIMNVRSMFCLCAVVALPVSAAEVPLRGQALGSVQSTVDFCAQLDPGSADKYQGFSKLVVEGAPGTEVEEVRRTDEYKEAYERVRAQLKDVPKDQAVESCKGMF